MLFMAGTRVSYILLAVLGAAPVAYHLVVGTPWRMQRFLAYFNPEAFANGEAYQFLQARLAIGSGGLTGTGLGDGHQSLGYMPEAHNDFILAPIGEELGCFGVALVLAAVRDPGAGAASARRSARATCSAATSRSASRCCSACRRCSTSASCSASCRTRASRCRSSATAVARS